MHAIERFTLNDDGELEWAFTATDPFIAEPFVGALTLGRSSVPYEPYECLELSGENNRRPEG